MADEPGMLSLKKKPVDSRETKNVCRSTIFRRQMKESDPEKYKLYLHKQKQISKEKRDELKKEIHKRKPSAAMLEKKEHQLVLQRARQQKYLDSQGKSDKLKVTWKSKSQMHATRNTVQSKKEYNRLMKQKQRASMNPQKKRWVAKKDRERKAAKKISKQKANNGVSKNFFHNPDTTTDKHHEPDPTPTTTTDKLHEPDPTPTTITDKHHEPEPITRDDEPNSRARNTSTKRKAYLKLCRENILNRYRIFNNYKRKSRVDSSGIKTFYIREDISRAMPQKRYATKQGAGYLLQISLRAAYSKYITENPTKRVCFAKFATLRPKNVRLLSNNHREYCCCVYCVNVRYKLLTLSREMRDTTKKKTNETDINDILLCPKPDTEKFHQPDCINGRCENCSTDYMKTAKTFYNDIADDKMMKWSRWERKMVNTIYKRVLVTKSGTKSVLLEELIKNDIEKPAQGYTFMEHLHTAHWQIRQFNAIKDELPDGNTLQVMDFAKNRAVKYQNEIKAAFYQQEQITMHPIVTYYKTSDGLVKDSSIIISEDLTHDHHAVEHYTNIVNEHIAKKQTEAPSRKIIFSDGCSSQYKSKGPFADISLNNSKINRNYFGSEHGKGEGDAEIGLLNRAIDRAIIGNQVIINNAEDMYNYAKVNLIMDEKFAKRGYIFVHKGEINRSRPQTEIKTVPQSRKFHQIINVTDKPYVLKTRNLSCFCQHCKSEEYHSCLNKKYVDNFQTQNLHKLCNNSENANATTNKDTPRRVAESSNVGGKRKRGLRQRGGRNGGGSIFQGQEDRIDDIEPDKENRRGRGRVRQRGGKCRGRRRYTKLVVSSSESESSDFVEDSSSPNSDNESPTLKLTEITNRRVRGRVRQRGGRCRGRRGYTKRVIHSSDLEPSEDRMKEAALVAVKEAGADLEAELQTAVQGHQSRLEDAEVEIRRLQWAAHDLDKENDTHKLPEESQQLNEKWDQQIVGVSRSQVTKDLELQNLREADENPNQEINQNMDDISSSGSNGHDSPNVDTPNFESLVDFADILEILSREMPQDLTLVPDGHPADDIYIADDDQPADDIHIPDIHVTDDVQPADNIYIPDIHVTDDVQPADDIYIPAIHIHDIADVLPADNIHIPDIHIADNVQPADDIHIPDIHIADTVQPAEDIHMVDDVSHPADDMVHPSKFSIGTHVMVKHGASSLPAVVVENPADIPTVGADIPVIAGIWVQCFKKTRSGWMLEEKKFFYLVSDVISVLQSPSIHCCGSRFYFKFENL